LIIPLFTIAVAELGDKTQISILLLSSKTKKHLQLLIGAILAFAIVDGIAIIAGTWITTIIPINYLKIISAIVFIIIGILILISKDDEEKETKQKNPFIAAFLIIMLTEWGDKTQIAAAIFATQYDAIFVFIGAVTALLILSMIAIFFGKIISTRIDKKFVNRIAGIIFIILGITFVIL
jgi:putative Ca2+/H+ antiporter (TMEM165/GDT1 family)